jgi:hypothetical protein
MIPQIISICDPLFILPPFITDIPHYCKRSSCEVDDGGVKCRGGAFTQLGGGFCTDRTLCSGYLRKAQEKKGTGGIDNALPHSS